MFSLQNQNQAILTLSQISTIITPCQNAYFNRKNKSTVKKQQTDAFVPPEDLCPESLIEVLKNCDFSFAKNLNFANLYTSRFLDKYRVSYVSQETFFENKYGFSEKDLQLGRTKIFYPMIFSRCNKIFISKGQDEQMLCSINSWSSRNRVPHGIQVRGFKTDRSILAEYSRNPNLLTRIKVAFGFGSTPEQLRYSSNTKLPTTDIQNISTSQTERLHKLLSDDANVTDAEKQRVKLAFAEGYSLGSNPAVARDGKAARYFKVFQQVLTIVIFLGIVISLMAGATGSVFRIQLGNQVEVDPEDIHVTFDDVKGADEAKQELKDVVEFLKNPDKFSTLGGKLPKGVLLVGPPGTGKTLLARAVAGEAGVPFFHAAGPEFDEILVGQGARRVRDLFKAAKERAPCVIFIDEIDSVGAKRTNSVLHPYANQTINQLLSEMDGFHQNEGVIVLGATNRRDDLDTALLRPGRFDVEVTVPTPDYTGRKEILGLYLSKILAKEIDVDLLARGTTGFTGADLESMVNQAALRAAIDGADSVGMKYLENARDKVLMGPERKSRIPDEEANMITAYHEGGHAVVAYYTKESHPLHKVTIIPRGPSLGHTAYIPEKERYHVTKIQLMAMMDTMMGGRAAEELVFGPDKITSGASSDLKQATSIAIHMVKDWGMSEKIGLRTMADSSKPFGDSLGPSTNEMVDNEIKRILSDSYERAKHILKTHSREHKALAEALIKHETLDAEDIKAIMMDRSPNIELKS